MFAPIIVPPLAVWIAVTWGWRWVFFSFAIPGIVAAIAWYLLVKSKPAESGFVSQSELAEINAGRESHNNSVRENILIADRFTWLDKIIRVKRWRQLIRRKAYSPQKIFSVTAWRIL
jgi:MFS family permease